ncbi:deoxyribose-phosphate aldolase [Penicillium cataractarum]|uniref:Deoxyribose-phosphate aldolase n=1 Tax=Penicillium cataractarum TaxID=2100454 RepID=A0A9W9SLF2_9EURO|nr:deoxyribose-phosphate aldolase [Penicillium cataractarum]KAJ5379844.1 deoxyribose-phosphate aldolase [Penicillium cataractarum]
MAPPTVDQLAKMIDHSVIDPFHTEQDLVNGIELAKDYHTGQFVTQPFRVKQARKLLEGTGINLQTFIGFPHGSDHTAIKVLQATTALEDGAQELDMVINLSALLSGDIEYVEQDIRAVVETAKVGDVSSLLLFQFPTNNIKSYGVVVKAIVEVFFLNDEQLTAAALAAERAGVGFIKTSTGTRPDEMHNVEHSVKLLRSILKPESVIKASGGCYTIEAILAYYKAGARRFGASETANILDAYSLLLDAGTTGLE